MKNMSASLTRHGRLGIPFSAGRGRCGGPLLVMDLHRPLPRRFSDACVAGNSLFAGSVRSLALARIRGPCIGGHVKSLRVSAVALSLTVASLATVVVAAQPSSAAGTPATISRSLTITGDSISVQLPAAGPRTITLKHDTYTWRETMDTVVKAPARTLVLDAGTYEWQCFLTGPTQDQFLYASYCRLENTATHGVAYLPYSARDEFALGEGTHTWTNTLTPST
jgi:hypothetical protein